MTSNQCRFQSADAAEVPQDSVMAHANAVALSHDHKTTVDGRTGSAKTFLERRTQTLMPVASGWEKLQMIFDSGASVSVVPPSVGGEYDIVCGRAAMAGVKYEIADGSQIPNLGEKLLPIVTRENTWRGLKVEVADIAQALQSVRSLVRTGHKVVFGDGPDGMAHYIEHQVTGEVNWVQDDGLNYLMTYAIAPKEAAGFTRPALPQ